MAQKWYVVWEGREPGVYRSWDDAKEQIDGFPGAQYKSFATEEAAINAYRGKPDDHLNIFRGMARQAARPMMDYDKIPGIELNAIAVDGACAGNPGDMEYQGVFVATGDRMFHFGPCPGGTNNIAEFLAIVHALAWLDQQHRPDIAVYSDSRSGMAWVRNRKAKTTIVPTPQNARIFQLIARAEAWLQQHPTHNRVLKWNTEQWGEIPADFGRK